MVDRGIKMEKIICKYCRKSGKRSVHDINMCTDCENEFKKVKISINNQIKSMKETNMKSYV